MNVDDSTGLCTFRQPFFLVVAVWRSQKPTNFPTHIQLHKIILLSSFMSVSHEHPTKPSIALTRPPCTSASKTTGFKSARYRNKTSIKRRRWPEDDNIPKTTEAFQPHPFDYFQEKAEKDNDARCVFLLWGSRKPESSPTRAVDVQIDSRDNEENIFEELAHRYTAQRNLITKCFTFREFDKLEPVTFRIICRSSKIFSVFMEPMDLADNHKLYSAMREEAHATIEKIMDLNLEDFPDHCRRESSGHYTHDNQKCPLNSPMAGYSPVCPFERWDRYNDIIKWIDTVKFLSCYFRNPAAARGQRILHGFESHGFIYYYSDINVASAVGWPENTFQPQNRDLSMNGLWEVVFGAGSFLVAIPMLAMAAMTHFEE
ncbi:hypothetical protein DPSP01_012889 [Paraphaeosphaeria sporulosa]